MGLLLFVSWFMTVCSCRLTFCFPISSRQTSSCLLSSRKTSCLQLSSCPTSCRRSSFCQQLYPTFSGCSPSFQSFCPLYYDCSSQPRSFQSFVCRSAAFPDGCRQTAGRQECWHQAFVPAETLVGQSPSCLWRFCPSCRLSGCRIPGLYTDICSIPLGSDHICRISPVV